ncbi:patatin-like phospholipase family protein [Turicibacter sp. H121]|uniref:patatin-like phospholipase family protein n=1 Tax=Turicibacter sp. H121 TaxID=1712675 RepID=UPI0021D4B434|nr:patatin-like phospholipase family protein [Turicibacter sp. H121]MCU7200612.1 patatin-like phospholipase family protein [Turicibacter sp. H121]
MKRIIRVLSFDGGGIRGIIPAKIMIKIEELLKVYSQNPITSICDYFDLIAGTSTGSILAGLYLCPDGFGSTHS